MLEFPKDNFWKITKSKLSGLWQQVFVRLLDGNYLVGPFNLSNI